MPDDCTGCGTHYGEFKTGFTFAEVRQQFWKNNDDPSTWHPKRRASVLGRWRELKQHMWEQHINECRPVVLPEAMANQPSEYLDAVPF